MLVAQPRETSGQNVRVTTAIIRGMYVYYIGTVCANPKSNYGVNIRLKMDLKKVHNFSQIFEQNINKAF